MAKFKVLELNEFILTRLGIFSEQFPLHSSAGFFKSPIICYILLVNFSFIISAASFAYQNLEQFSVALRTFTYFMGESQVFWMFIFFGLNVDKVEAIHLKLQDLVDESMNGKWFEDIFCSI